MFLLIEVKVVPLSRKSYCILDAAGKLKCYVKSPAQKNKANQELIELFAQSLKIPKQDIMLVAGLTNRTKKIKIMKKISFDDLLQALNIEQQCSLLK